MTNLPTTPAQAAQDPIIVQHGPSLMGVALACGLVVCSFALTSYSLGKADGRVETYRDGECVTRDECDGEGGEVTSEIEPLVGPGFVDSFAVNCLRTAATKIEAPCGQVSYEAQVPSAATASVVFGDSAITASAGGIVRAAGEINGGNVRYEYCRTTLDAGVSINVRALCSSAP